MREAIFTRKLLRALRSHAALKDAVIFKYADRFSAGIPDFSVTLNERTTWWEVKVKPNTMTKLQSWFIAKLGATAFCIRTTKDGKWVEIFNANYGRGTNFDAAIEEIAKMCQHGH